MTAARAKYVGLFLAFFGVAMGYSLYTDHVWEDYFITFRHSQNLAEGRGFVFHEGERIHGFTSPLGTLLPALFHRLAGNPESFRPALGWFRLVGAVGYALAGVLLVRLAGKFAPQAPAVGWIVAVLYAVEFKSVAFSMNGQEAGLLLAFLAWTLCLLEAGVQRQWLWLGVAWAGLQWTRPDGCVWALGSALAALLFPGAEKRIDVFRNLAKAGGVAALLYAPWLIWTTDYYGTPIPHTIFAKAGSVPTPSTIWGQFGVLDRLRERACGVFEPVYVFFGGWPDVQARLLRGVGLAAACAWLLPAPTAVRRAGFMLWGGIAYLSNAMMFPWYMPPFAALAILILGWTAVHAPRRALLLLTATYLFVVAYDLHRFDRIAAGKFLFKPLEIWIAVGAVGFVAALTWATRTHARRIATSLVAVAVFGLFGLTAVESAEQMRVQQAAIEFGNRRPLGLWLREHAKPEESVYLECLGYIGYFRGPGRMLDHPGLVSPRVVKVKVAAFKRGDRWMLTDLIPELQPDWLVLRRKHEYPDAMSIPWTAANYEVVREFDVSEKLRSAYPHIMGRGYLENDAAFVVLRRKR